MFLMWMVLLWVLLWGGFTLANLFTGVLVAAVVLVAVPREPPTGDGLDFRTRFRARIQGSDSGLEPALQTRARNQRSGSAFTVEAGNRAEVGDVLGIDAQIIERRVNIESDERTRLQAPFVCSDDVVDLREQIIVA